MDITLDVITEEIISVDVIEESAIQLTVVTGLSGTDGAGVVAGGTTGQILRKKSNTNFDTEWANPEAAAGVSSVNGEAGDVTLTQDDIGDGATYRQYSATEKTKLAGIATGATANATDANLRDRSTHTGNQAISTVTGLQAALDGKAASSHTHTTSQITDFTTAVDARVQNIVAAAPAALDTLDELAAALGDDANFAGTVTIALAGKQPLDADLTAIAGLAPADDAIIQRKSSVWAARTMAQLKTDLALTKSDVGLSNVDNVSDANKPISTAQQAALDARFVWADGTNTSGARPSTSSKVIWVGGTTQPTNMSNGDLWIKA